MGGRTKIFVGDDDVAFRTRVTRALASRGVETCEAGDVVSAMPVARAARPGGAIGDVGRAGKSGRELIPQLAQLDPETQIVVLTGYGSIATGVEAVRRGAIDYLNKPVDAEQILAAFERDGADAAGGATPAPADVPPSLARGEWEHIQRTLADCSGNISEAARRLGIHRRSLQRKLSKLPPTE